MLKWTVTRGVPSSESSVSRPPTADDVYSARPRGVVGDAAKVKSRRSSNSRHRSTSRKSSSPILNKVNLEDNKENCFTSTPIKSSEIYYHHDVLRDVSNLTPTDTNNRRSHSVKRCREQKDDKKGSSNQNNFKRKSPLSEKKKKKKTCLNNSHDQYFAFSPSKIADGFSTNYFKSFQSVDSHIEGIPNNDRFCGCKKENACATVLNCVKNRGDYYAPTLPTFDVEDSPCFIRTNHNFNILDRKSCSSRLSLPLNNITCYHNEQTNCDTDDPPVKRSKFDFENDELPPIQFATPFIDTKVGKLEKAAKPCSLDEINVSPLVKRLIDLRFSKISYDGNAKINHNNSSYINNLSLDKIVDAILETTNEEDNSVTKEISSENTSMVVNLDPRLQERENELNETHEENLINSEHERQISASTGSYDRNSFDSGFSSTTTKQFHDVGTNFICKCNNNNDKTHRIQENEKRREDTHCDKTVIDLNDSFNERCVDDDIKVRNGSCFSVNSKVSLKRSYTDNSNENDLNEGFALKRQKCIRRRKTSKIYGSTRSKLTENKISNPAPFPKLLTEEFDNVYEIVRDETTCSFDTSNTSLIRFNVSENSATSQSLKASGCQLEQTQTVKNSSLSRRSRRCLSFESMDDNSVRSRNFTFAKVENGDVQGSMDLDISYQTNELVLKVLRCKDLSRSGIDGQINAYVKVILSDRIPDAPKKRNGILQRTAVQANSCRPTFNHTFRLPIHKQDISKRLHIEVWHRDRTYRRSDFLGCMSFTVKNVIKKEISGSYRLLPQSTGRCQNVPITKYNLAQSFASAINDSYNMQTEDLINMCDSQTTNEEIMSIDDFDGDLKKTSNTALLNQHQKDADENLFLRYLELDPTEGPDAIPAATQRKATGNKNGRTPFTTTKKLIRMPKTGFGFSVVWTHPPRIERVEKGLPADKAGILPGDYIIFVDTHNVVTMPEIDILNLIKSFGFQLTLEIFRRNASRNGSTMSVQPLPLPNLSGLPTPSFTTQHRPSTIGSINTASAECSRRKLHLPQITFHTEVGNGVIV